MATAATHSMSTRPRVAVPRSHYRKLTNPFSLFTKERLWLSNITQICHRRSLSISRIQASEATNGGGGDSYLDTWKKVVDNERKSVEFQKIDNNSAKANENDEEGKEESKEELERRNNEFNKLLEVSTEERDMVQRMQVIDRATVAIAAAKALLKKICCRRRRKAEWRFFPVSLRKLCIGTPGPNFWAWTPPPDDDNSFGNCAMKPAGKASPDPSQRSLVMERSAMSIFCRSRLRLQCFIIDRATVAIAAAKALLKENLLPEKEVSGELIPGGGGTDMGDQQEENQNGGSFVSPSGSSGIGTPGPNFWAWTPPPDDDNSFGNGEMKPAGKASPDPSQRSLSLEEVDKMKITSSTGEAAHLVEEREIGVEFSALSAEASHALSKMDEVMTHGINPDGSRGVSADKTVEWENKYWEAADEFGYNELASEKSGRDAVGNVWHEYWRESMSQIEGLVHLEKTADKWGKNKQGDEWQEQWWEHYGASGKGDKWAHKWCSIDPNTPLRMVVLMFGMNALTAFFVTRVLITVARWGEKYDGQGGSTKNTDKWAERFQGDGWDKWGDKWDEHFDLNGHGIKQGEKWWEDKHRDRWNRTWGEGHNGSGWYGKSSSGEHWDKRIQQDTWYEKFPHYGFYHCFENSVQLREVKKPSECS
ncbi:Hypothetical predicted protein [Olea europaea subsp. europaea]|uniref:Uncharacterized protein n=1 Tax=Olea europaea subsp. europaea TaxID=158383 RepID=A0A8S0Q0M6_OLEEU|nr:Hypothetical predicted protein [Olea europaea subsp. europaea]